MPSQRGHAALILILIILLAIAAIFINQKANKPSMQTKPVTKEAIDQPVVASMPTPKPAVPHHSITNVYSYDGTTFSILDTLNPVDSPSFGNIGLVFSQKGLIYFNDDGGVSSYSLATKKQEKIYAISSPDEQISRLEFVEPNILYISEAPKQIFGEKIAGVYQIRELNMDTKAIRTIGPIKTVLYGGAEYLFHSTEGDIVASFGGDGCGGYGEIYRNINSESTEIVKTGGGCNDSPHYLGFSKGKNSLLMASVKQDSYTGTNIQYDELYFQNVKTLEKEVILDLKTIPQIKEIFLYDAKNKVGIVTDKELFFVNPLTKQIEKQVDWNGSAEAYDFSLDNDKVYYSDYDKQSFSALDINTKTLTTISIGVGKLPFGNDYPIFLGNWQKQRIFYTTND